MNFVNKKYFIFSLLVSVLTFFTPGGVFAAGKRACVSDAKKYCPGLKMGEGLGKCLLENKENLTPDCQEKLGEGVEKLQALAKTCEADAAKFCKGIKPQGGKIAHCLGEHSDEITPACKNALKGRS